MTDVEYPYLPPNKTFKFVPADNPFMLEAKKAQETLAGDPSYPVGIVLVKDGQVIARAGNGYNQGRQPHICPRIVLECPSGTGYDLCDLHLSPGHAEPMVVEQARQLGVDTVGADSYMYGHWWCCESCWDSLLGAGVRDVYLVDNAHELFHRDRVYAQTLQPSIKSVYIAGSMTNLTAEERQWQYRLYECLGVACHSISCDPYIPHIHTDPEMNPDAPASEVFRIGDERARQSDVTVAEVTHPSLGAGGEIVAAHQAGKKVILLSKKGTTVSRFVLGNPAVVYHVEYENQEEACRRLRNVLKQM